MMTIEYDQTIDTLDDMLRSELPLMCPFDTPVKFFLESDPRPKVQELRGKVKEFKLGRGGKLVPSFVANG